MLSIAKINSAANQIASGSQGKGYLHYLGSSTTRNRGDFDDYARGGQLDGPPPFWACKGAALLGLDALAEAEQVERLARGFHPVTGVALVKGAGNTHVMGLDLTFSAPKDFSAVFAGADDATKEALIECLQESARAALGYAESASVSRHGHGGLAKQVIDAGVAACYTHFASRALDPQLHVHAFLFNAGKRRFSEEWSAVEQRPMFDRKMATGILFRAELASRLAGLGFGIVPTGPYFAIQGISEEQREALSSRSREIAEYLQENAVEGLDAASRDIAALNTRNSKSEPPLPTLLCQFEKQAAKLGITPQAVSAMRMAGPPPPFTLDHAKLLDEILADKSCATAHQALELICEKAMGQWSAARCLQELDAFLQCEQVARLGYTEMLSEVFTSKATQALEETISQRVAAGKDSRKHRLRSAAIDAHFDQLESELRKKLGVGVSLSQQRQAALHIASDTGDHAFVEGWAGTGKTTMLKALGEAYKAAGFTLQGCCQSAAASQNLARETGIPSRTIASLLLSLQEGKTALTQKSIVILDEAGMVGSREFDILQGEATKAGAKLVCVGDPKQLQPIEAGGIFRSLMDLHGKAEISTIQRQRTDFAPLFDWLAKQATRPNSPIKPEHVDALRLVPEDARHQAVSDLCQASPKTAKAFERWQARFDYSWLRQAVEHFAKGEAVQALDLLEAKKRLKLLPSADQAMQALVEAWDEDKTSLDRKAMVAATRLEVTSLNAKARGLLVERGQVADALGIDAEIIHRDESTDEKRFAPGDRVVFTKNDRMLGVANGVAGSIVSVSHDPFEPSMVVALDDPNHRGEKLVEVPMSFGRFDHAYCLTNHKSQGRTFDAAYVLANPSMADREWTYVAASRSRFATTIFANVAALGLAKTDGHAGSQPKASRQQAIDALASRMSRTGAKGTTLDYQKEIAKASAVSPSRAPEHGTAWSLQSALQALRRRLSLNRQITARP